LSDLETRGNFASLATCSITELAFVRIACIGERFANNVRTAIRDLKRMKDRRQLIS
jgi:hypothetical protein